MIFASEHSRERIFRAIRSDCRLIGRQNLRLTLQPPLPGHGKGGAAGAPGPEGRKGAGRQFLA